MSIHIKILFHRISKNCHLHSKRKLRKSETSSITELYISHIKLAMGM